MSAVRATVRLQLHRHFTFADAQARLDYFSALGISHLYLSPIATAQPGSLHGYDVIDPTRVSRALGGERGLHALVTALRQRGMGLIVDIVPNHMAADPRNRWWADVLRRGRRSRFAAFFDIDWRPPEATLHDRVLLPILAEKLAAAVAARRCSVVANPRGELELRYRQQRLPLSSVSHATLLGALEVPAFRPIARGFAAAVDSPHAEDFSAACRQFAQALRQPDLRAHVDHLVRVWSADPARMEALLDSQRYQLACWREASTRINWRRFFDINGLVALRMEHPAAFDAVHALPLRLYAKGWIDGVRVDHVDGLHNPRAYCQRLHDRLDAARARRPGAAGDAAPFVVVEKILAHDETLPSDWPVDGSTGYDFMDAVGAVLHAASGAPSLDRAWCRVAPALSVFAELRSECRGEVVDTAFAADVQRAERAFRGGLACQETNHAISPMTLRQSLRALLVTFPIYRSYLEPDRAPSDQDRAAWRVALDHARHGASVETRATLAQLRRWIDAWPDSARGVAGAARVAAIMRLQQLLPAIAAKGIEDRADYRYARLLSRCEVGADPGQLARSVEEFHGFLVGRAKTWPRTLSTTASHDHKRGEDVRARLAVLSEMADAWADLAAQWRELLAPARQQAGGAPVAADEYALWQMLLGMWPWGLRFADSVGIEALRLRLDAWLRKALREAGQRSSWQAPDQRYEDACAKYLANLLGTAASATFQQQFLTLIATIAPAGAINGWAQTLLRIAAPGVADLYQGNAFCDSSAVDPDNRRPVEYAARERTLNADGDVSALLDNWSSGALKQHIVQAALQARKRSGALFTSSSCIPLAVSGPAADHVIAFARRDGERCAVVVVARHSLALLHGAAQPRIDARRWQRTVVVLDDIAGGRFVDVIANREVRIQDRTPVARLLAKVPAALLVSSPLTAPAAMAPWADARQ